MCLSSLTSLFASEPAVCKQKMVTRPRVTVSRASRGNVLLTCATDWSGADQVTHCTGPNGATTLPWNFVSDFPNDLTFSFEFKIQCGADTNVENYAFYVQNFNSSLGLANVLGLSDLCLNSRPNGSDCFTPYSTATTLETRRVRDQNSAIFISSPSTFRYSFRWDQLDSTSRSKFVNYMKDPGNRTEERGLPGKKVHRLIFSLQILSQVPADRFVDGLSGTVTVPISTVFEGNDLSVTPLCEDKPMKDYISWAYVLNFKRGPEATALQNWIDSQYRISPYGYKIRNQYSFETLDKITRSTESADLLIEGKRKAMNSFNANIATFPSDLIQSWRQTLANGDIEDLLSRMMGSAYVQTRLPNYLPNTWRILLGREISTLEYPQQSARLASIGAENWVREILRSDEFRTLFAMKHKTNVDCTFARIPNWVSDASCYLQNLHPTKYQTIYEGAFSVQKGLTQKNVFGLNAVLRHILQEGVDRRSGYPACN